MIGLVGNGLHLGQDFPSGEVAREPELACRTECAGQGAADLRADAHGVLGRGQGDQPLGLTAPALFLQGARVRRIGKRDAYGLDLRAIGQPEQILHEAIVGAPALYDLEVGIAHLARQRSSDLG